MNNIHCNKLKWCDFFESNNEILETKITQLPDLSALIHTSTVWATTPGAICQAINEVYFEYALNNPNIACIIADDRIKIPTSLCEKVIIRSKQCTELFLRAHLYFASEQMNPLADKSLTANSADIHPTSVLIGNVTVGENVVIGPNVTIFGPTIIGNNTRVQSNVTIGEEGLFVKKVNGRLQNIPHFGGVKIGSNCFIHSGAVIVKSTFHGLNTMIGSNCHVGVMSNIGHDVYIDDETVISSNCVIAGRAKIGNRVWVGASSSIANSINIGDESSINIGAVVIKDVAPNSSVSGNFAISHKKHLLNFARTQHE